MSRVLFARSARGGIIRSIQQSLVSDGCYTGVVDGLYGGGTERAVSTFQKTKRLSVTGAVDDITWTALMRQPVPTIFERALQLTAAFEGHGFGMVQGNWDNAWLTWGIIGFTLKHGEIQKILLSIENTNPKLLRDCFGEQTPDLLKILQGTRAVQEAWANTISDGAKVREPWRSGFQRLGLQPMVQSLQLDRARIAYFEPALKTAARFQLSSEQGIALCFDIHVQNGGAARVSHPPLVDEPSRRIALANAVADLAKTAFREDVRARKLALATGAGFVHGEMFTTRYWGISEHAALAASSRRREGS